MTALKISGTLENDPLIHADGKGIVATVVLVYAGGGEMHLAAFGGPAQYLAGLHAQDSVQVGGRIRNSAAGIEMLVDSVNPALVEAIPSPIKPLAVPMKKSPRRAKRCS
jgi:hypothetical protein